jgi:membrane associated rhomboid family serine protease
MDQQSTIRWGLIPNEPSLVTLLSSQFMHGDWFHLLGNMLFLIMFGIAMERHWGARRFLPAYLLCGIGAGLLFIASAPNSGIPLVGASGAISGLMGLFAGTFRLRKLEFFYTLGFFFGSFRAPALVLFPVWLGWELIQAATMNSNVAYMAHAGGLLTGLALAFLLPFTEQPNRQKGTQPGMDGDDTQVPAICQQLAEQLRFDDAQSRCRQWLVNHPKSRPLWFFFLQMGLRRKQLDAAMKEAVKTLSERQGSDALLGALWQEYEFLGGDIRALPPAYQLLLAELAWRQQRSKLVREIVQDLQKKQWQHPRLERLSQRL